MDLTLAGSKLRKTFGSQLRESVSAPVSSFAVQQLEKMGWTAGTGLGRKRDGCVTHIRVVQRQDSVGLGSTAATSSAAAAAAAALPPDEWWKDSLGDTLAKLSSAGGGGGSEKNKKRSKKTFTDEELFAATGGARFGMRAGRTRNLAKWRRTESNVSSSSAATSSANSTADGNHPDGTKLSNEHGLDDTTSSSDDKEGIKKQTRDEKNTAKLGKKEKKSKKRSLDETDEERKERKRLRKEKKKRKKEVADSA